MITRFERARIIGARALQLSLGAPALVKIPKSIDQKNTLEVARYELDKKAVPIVVVRKYPNGKEEIVEP